MTQPLLQWEFFVDDHPVDVNLKHFVGKTLWKRMVKEDPYWLCTHCGERLEYDIAGGEEPVEGAILRLTCPRCDMLWVKVLGIDDEWALAQGPRDTILEDRIELLLEDG